MSDLITFLRARLDEDEQLALAVAPLGHTTDLGGHRMDETFVIVRSIPAGEDGSYRQKADRAASAHFLRHDPARTLADAAAKRAIVEIAQFVDQAVTAGSRFARISAQNSGAKSVLTDVLRQLAQPYADHPDYREEWRP